MAFEKGSSGNPSGRPKGTTTAAKIRKLLDSRSKELIDKTVELALDGHPVALKLCLERLCPALKPKDDGIKVAGFKGGNLSEQGEQILSMMSKGALSPSETSSLLGALANQARLVEVDDLMMRVSELEKAGTA